MKITFTRRKGFIGSLVGFNIQINDVEVQSMYPGDTYVYEGEPSKDIRITGVLSPATIIPLDVLGDENSVYLQYTVGFWAYGIQAIVSSGEKMIGVFEKTRIL